MSDQASRDSGTYVGIDLGTTYSSVAYLDPKGKPLTVPNSDGEPATPSMVLLDSGSRIVVGKEAKRALLVRPDRVADLVKRDMGERYYSRKILGRQMSPVTLSSLILKKLKQDTEARIGPIAGAVITVPAYFNEARRRATMEAGRMAGLRIIDILNEPTAAALAYAFREFVARGGNPNDRIGMAVATTAPHKALVYDLGGGTFDATLLHIAGDDLKVLGTDGDMQLGGRDWDDQIVNYVAEQFRMTGAGDPLGDPKSHQALLLAAEEAKIKLSREEEATITLAHNGRKAEIPLPRSKFENLTAHLLFRTHSRLDSLIGQANLSWSDIDEILAVGGSSRMPQVLELLERVTGKKPNLSLSPDEVVAHGAAIHAAICAIGAEGSGRTHLPAPRAAAPIPVSTPTPVSDVPAMVEAPQPHEDLSDASAVAEAASPDDSNASQFGMPAEHAAPAGTDEGEAGVSIAIANEMPPRMGASFQLGPDEHPSRQFDAPIAESLSRVRKHDVSAHSLGVVASTKAGRKISAILIPRNTGLPVIVTQRYGTESDGQTHVKIQVIEGESDDAEECMEVGRCYIRDLPAGLPRASPVEVTFTYDSNGLLAVTAVEVSSGRSATTTIERSAAFSGPAIERARQAVGRATVV